MKNFTIEHGFIWCKNEKHKKLYNPTINIIGQFEIIYDLDDLDDSLTLDKIKNIDNKNKIMIKCDCGLEEDITKEYSIIEDNGIKYIQRK